MNGVIPKPLDSNQILFAYAFLRIRSIFLLIDTAVIVAPE